MKIDTVIASLPHLVQVMSAAQAAVTSIVAAVRAAHPADLEHVTDAQIIARAVGGATTGVANVDALIDRLTARIEAAAGEGETA